jgi:hypothetical protein
VIEAKAFRTFNRVYALFRSERLSANIKGTLQCALIRVVTTRFAADNQLLKLEHLQIKFPRAIGKYPSCTPVRELHMAFQVLYIYNYITKLFRQQANVIQNYENANVRDIGKGETRHRKYKRLKLGGGQAYDRSGD